MDTDVIKIENVNSCLLSNDVALKKQLHQELRAREKGYIHSKAYKQKLWDGYREFFKPQTGRFMTGLLPHVIKTMKLLNKPYKVIDLRSSIKWAYTDITPQFLHPWFPEGEEPFDLYDYQVDYIKQALKYHRGLITPPTGCHRKGQHVLMYDGYTKAVENIVVGDLLMGPDSCPRRVYELCRGRDEMFEIRPNRGEPFVVNGNHILALKRIDKGQRGKITEVKVRDYLQWSNTRKHIHKLYTVAVDFPSSERAAIDPYFLGLLLGDGSLVQTPRITTNDKEIVSACQFYAASYGLDLEEYHSDNTRPSYLFSGTKGKENPLTSALKRVGIWGHRSGTKFIPHQYLTGSRSDRLQLLAGLMDTDGVLSKGCFYFVSKSHKLTIGVASIARSLGFGASSVKKKIKTSQNGKKGIYWYVSLSGNLHLIPTRLPRKQYQLPSGKKKDATVTGFTIIPLGTEEEYYGFRVDKDSLYLLDTYTVSHNSGKTNILIGILKCLPPKTPVLFLTKNASLVNQNYREMQKWGIENVGRYYGGYKEPNYIMCCTAHKDTLAGIDRLLPKFKALIVDEVHDCMSNVPMAAYKKMTNASVRLGISATPFKFAGKDKVQKYNVMGHFGAVFKTNTTESGYLTTKELQGRQILSKSHVTVYPIDTPDNIAHEPYMDAVTMGIANNIEFLRIVTRLARSLKGRTLILVERIDQGNYLKQLIPEAHWIKGADKISVREEVFKDLKKGENVIAICMRQIVTAGINVFVHNMINASGGQAEHSVIQQMGRGLRCAPDKEYLDFYDFLFRTNQYLFKHSTNRINVLAEEGHDMNIKEAIDF